MGFARGLKRSSLAALLIISCGAWPTLAGVTNWTNASLGDWFIAGNWSNGVPDASSSAYIASGGTAFINTAPTIVATTGSLHIGVDGSSGTLLLSRSGAGDPGILRHSELYVGEGSPNTGTLNISSGAKLTLSTISLTALTLIGFNAQSKGNVTVSDPGSELNSINLIVGNAGTATLSMSNGGKVYSLYSIIGKSPGSNGTVTVTGSGSAWLDNSLGLFVGGSGNLPGGAAILNVLGNGLVQTRVLKIFNTGTVVVDNGSITSGGLLVSGPADSPTAGGVLGDIVIGNATGGRMEVTSEGTIFNHRGFIGQNAGGANGSVLVTDPGSKWMNNGSVWVGNSGSGALEVRNGGVVTSEGNGYLGFAINSSGYALVSGSGSNWTTAVTLHIGGNAASPGGSGTLSIQNGGTISATETKLYNTGILELGANPILNGLLTVLGGRIQAVDNTTFAKDITLASEGLLVYTSGHEAIFSGNLSGPGGLTKGGTFTGSGPGTLTLMGQNTYTGPTIVSYGTLLVDGSITSAVTVNDGATLGGSGAVGTVSVNSGGAIALGKTLGRLTINGNYTQASGGSLIVELGGYTPASGYDQLAVSGLATIAGALEVRLINKFRPRVGDTFAIVTSSSETGNFAFIESCGFTVRSDASPTGILLTVTSVDPLPVVMNNNDSGPGSLRSVISNACPGDIISFAVNVRGAIALTSGELVIDKPLTINGPGANLLSVERGAGAGNFRIFNIALSSVVAKITGLTIANGNVPGTSGGGILNYGNLTLGGVTVSGNTANFGGNGGGIFNSFGTLTIGYSTISGNSVSSTVGAGSGGGIFNSGGKLTIAGSTISGNSALGPGGTSDSGGGIITNVGSVTLTNSTISGNLGDLGGGIRNVNGGVVRARNTIIALNTSASGPDFNGPLTSDGFNLIGNAAGAVISPSQASDRIGVAPVALNLGQLQYNGGSNRTHALLSGSAAIDQGNSSGAFTDQRGFNRLNDFPGSNALGGDGTDIGAYEFGGEAFKAAAGVSREPNGSVSLTFVGAPFTVYSVQFATELGGAWAAIGDVTTDGAGIGEFQHASFSDPPPGLLQSFYRLEH